MGESPRRTLFFRCLGDKLVALNLGLPEFVYQETLRLVYKMPSSTNIIAVHKEKYSLHKNEVEVSYLNDKGDRIKKRLRLFDFDNYENNHFLLVREFLVKGDIYRRRADLVEIKNYQGYLVKQMKRPSGLFSLAVFNGSVDSLFNLLEYYGLALTSAKPR